VIAAVRIIRDRSIAATVAHTRKTAIAQATKSPPLNAKTKEAKEEDSG
jgi:hypothetical protein